MRKMIKKIKTKKGYISIEVILVAGILIALAVGNIATYKKKSTSLTSKAITELNRVDDAYS